MKKRNLFAITAFMALAVFFYTSCSEEEDYRFGPYTGCRWQAVCNGDTLRLELLTENDVELTAKSAGTILGCGKYETYRGILPFHSFGARMNNVAYRFYYASLDLQLNMVLHGDSLNTLCDTVPVPWSCAFAPFDGLE